MKYARIAVAGATRWGIVRGHEVQLIDGSDARRAGNGDPA